MANKKSSNLRYSYTVFRWGLILSILAFLTIKSIQFYFPHNHEAALEQVASTNTSILKFNQIYEPSGVQQLEDGRLIIIEDEPERPLHILKLDATGELKENKSLDVLLPLAFSKKLDDLEAITMGPDGYIYATTSHKRNKKGQRKTSREQLIRFKIKGNTIVDTGIVTNLHDAIKKSGILGSVNKRGKDGLYNLNIEALSFNKKNQLMVCLRKPQLNKKSIILIIENPETMFSNKEMPLISKTPILLELQGSGIRAISYDSKLKGYLLTNEIYTNNDRKIKHSQILFWSGNPKQQPKSIKLPSLINMNNVEGIAPVTVNGDPRVLLIRDNGEIKQNRPANYLFLDYHQLKNPN